MQPAYTALTIALALALLVPACGSTDEGPAAEVLPAAPQGMTVLGRGCFIMGSPEQEGDPFEHPVRRVDHGVYAMDLHPVSHQEFAAFLQANGNVCGPEGRSFSCYDCEDADAVIDCGAMTARAQCQSTQGGPADSSCDQHPVTDVSWYGAAAYCEWRGQQLEAPWTSARLPTEAEWERASRGPGGDTCENWSRYTWGPECPPEFLWDFYPGVYLHPLSCSTESWTPETARVNCMESDCGDGWDRTSPRGAFAAHASPEGIQDLLGNVFEWVADGWIDNYVGASERAEDWTAEGDFRVRRGGSFAGMGRTARSAYRTMDTVTAMRDFTGFRCVATQEAPAELPSASSPPPGPAQTWDQQVRNIMVEHCAPCHTGDTLQGCLGDTCMSSDLKAWSDLYTCCQGAGSTDNPNMPCSGNKPMTVAECGLNRILEFPDVGKDPMPPEQIEIVERWLQAQQP